MNKLIFALICAFCFQLGPISAQTVSPIDPERVDEFIEVVATNECRITNKAAEIYLPAAGFNDKDEVRGIMARLLFYGRARVVDAGRDHALVVYDGPCPPAEKDTDARRIFMNLIAENGCSLDHSDAPPLLQEVGLLIEEAELMFPLLQSVGDLTLSDDKETLSMTDEDCNYYSDSPELVEDLINDPIKNPRAALIEYLEITGCELTYEDAQEALPAAGFDFVQIDRLVQDYLSEGIMYIGPNDTLVLKIGKCG